jgi:DNA-binding MarR family transcriptional regulator
VFLQKYRKEVGFTGIPNPIMMLIVSSNLTQREIQVLMWILNETIGWNRLETYFDIGEWSVKVGIPEKTLYKVLGTLENRGVIERSRRRRDTKSKGVLRLEINHLLWDIPHDNELVRGSVSKNHKQGGDDNSPNDDEINDMLNDL